MLARQLSLFPGANENLIIYLYSYNAVCNAIMMYCFC